MSRKRSVKPTKPVIVHVIEVFSDASDEHGWLYYSPKTPEEIASAFKEISGTVGEDEFEPISHEPEIKGWFIAEPSSVLSETVEGYGAKFEAVLDRHLGEWYYCSECASREPCRVWHMKTIMLHGYDILENDPWMEAVSAFEAFVRKMMANAPSSGMTVEAAAKTLGVEWPVTRESLEKAFKKAAMKAHPDLGGDDTAMRMVIMARDVLLKAMS